ncbi:MAG: hypothetical protein ACYC69_09165 [Thermodesulfovibrionales bacterium]
MKKAQIVTALKRIFLGLFLFILVPVFSALWYKIQPAERVNINDVLEGKRFVFVIKSESDGSLFVGGFLTASSKGNSFNVPIQNDFVKVNSKSNSRYMARNEPLGLRVVLRLDDTSRFEYIVRDNTVIPYSRKVPLPYEFLIGGATTFLFWLMLRAVKKRFRKNEQAL